MEIGCSCCPHAFDDVRFVLTLILRSRIDQNGVPSELAPVPYLGDVGPEGGGKDDSARSRMFCLGPVPLHPDDGKKDMLRCLFLDVKKLSYKALILSNSFSEFCFVALLDFPSTKNRQPCLHLDVPGS